MRPTAVFFGYLFCCLVLSALATYPLMQTGWIAYEPQRVMGRVAQLFILIGLWPFLRWTGLAERGALGFGVPRADLTRAILRGWVLGVAILLALVAAELGLGVRVPEPPSVALLASALEKALAALIGGLLIGLLEETFFRGALYTAIRRGGGVVSAAAWSALLYALVHFLKPHALPAGVAFDWTGAGMMFTGVFAGLLEPQHLDSLAALFMAGVFLALVRERTGHIGWCIGLHAGWVFVIQLTRHLSDGDEASRWAFLTGGYDGVIGWLAVLWLALLSAALWWWPAPRGRAAPASGAG